MKNFPIFPAFASGLLLLLSSPGSAEFWPLAWVALVPFLMALPGKKSLTAARLGLLTGLVYYTALFYWILIVLGVYGHLPWWLTIPALLLLALYMATYTALFAAICSWALRRGMPLLWIAPPLWVALDFIRGRLFSGFPWQDLAYSQYKAPMLIQTADLVGHHGVTFYIVLVNCLICTIISWRAKSPARVFSSQRLFSASVLSALILIVMALGYNSVRYRQITELIDSSSSIELAVVQGNIPQELKWTPEIQQETVLIYTELSERILKDRQTAAKPLLLIWPETALPFYAQNSPIFDDLIDGLIRKHRFWLLTGAPYFEQSGPTAATKYFNSAILVSPQGLVADRYDKQHLVPFGEYIPLRRLLMLGDFLRPLVETVGDFTPGQERDPLICQNARIGVLICFESIFPDLARKWVGRGANLLVNLTNDAWFGRSSAPWQHFSMGVFRSVETRRSLARAANTGISGFVDPLGRQIENSSLFSPAFLKAELPLLENESFYLRYGFFFPLACLVFVVVVLAGQRIRKGATDK